ncbi:hypothetical protein [Holospora undulata]|uniref:hypothetical protein n=1 Tax=Holospora undulata TaxID=1169117 RepID=UPI0003A84A29|nr:hypothetical protein [Holospora undulata]
MKWVGTLGSRICAKIEPSKEDKDIVKEIDEFWHYLKKRSKKFGFLKLGFLKSRIMLENGLSIGNLVIA